MQTFTNLEDFLAELPWSDNVRHKLRVTADRDDVRYLVAYYNAGKLSAQVYTGKPKEWPSGTAAIWPKPLAADDPRSKTQQAVALVFAGMNANAAAKQLGVHPSAVYRALTRAHEKPLCPCCGQVVREGFSIDESVLKNPSGGQASA